MYWWTHGVRTASRTDSGWWKSIRAQPSARVRWQTLNLDVRLAVVIATFWAVTARNIRAGALGERLRTHPTGRTLAAYHPTLTSLTVVVVLALATQRFWDYWSTLI